MDKDDIEKSIFGKEIKDALTPLPSAKFRADVLSEVRACRRQEKGSWSDAIYMMLEPKNWITAAAMACVCGILFVVYMPVSETDSVYASSGFAAVESDIDDWLFSEVSENYF
ncbi:MAG: hypothetical protein PHC51_06960 [bacterium]|nr:hypothetical protein [bacterium]